MSRCFPFPPPGYGKARVDNTDLLNKGNHKEKGLKKDEDKKRKKEEKKRHKKSGKDKSSKDRVKDKNKTSDEKILKAQPKLPNGETSSSNNLQISEENKNSLHLQELVKRTRDESTASGSYMVQKVATDERDLVRTMVADRSFSNQLEGNDKFKKKFEDLRKVNGKNDTRGLEKPFGEHFSDFDKRVDRTEALIKLEENQNVKHKEESQGNGGDKLRSRERDKTKRSKDKDRGKEEKKKAKEIIEPSKEQLKPNENVSRLHDGNKDSLDFRNIKSPESSLNLSTISPAGMANLGKRKELERNGYLLDNGSRPNKLPRNPPSSQHVVQNGRKLEPCQTSVELKSELAGLARNNHNVSIKEQKSNGSIQSSDQSDISSSKFSNPGIPAKQKVENFSKPPHPDMKYLGQILCIPKMEEWSDTDDQEWLFSGIESQSKKGTTSTSSSWNEGIQQVWAEAFRIESADISALPYVIPY
ncbi:hypothetical protein M5689_019042 [Euphorbia peplus]|nr:hypothetical protein M5689_019042 [Euphorbia peplus]